MTDPSLGFKKRKITYAASPQGVEKAEKALKRLGFESKINFAKSNLLSRSTVTKFFNSQPIQLDSLKRICKALTLDWKEIVPRCEEEQSKRPEINELSNSDTNEGVEQVQTLSRKVTVLDKQSQVIKVVIILEGDFNSINNNLSVSLQAILREFSGDTIKITDIEEGSIRLIIEGSPGDIEQLLSKFNSGELTEVSGFPVENIQILSESSDDDESNELNDKWRLVQKIVSRAVEGRNLSGADLSDADLSGADLSNADLSDTDLSNADLSGANLSGADMVLADLRDANLSGAFLRAADLSNADLSNADLSNADLRGADLRGADLRGANLRGANPRGANLTLADLRGTRIDTQTKIDSKWRLAWEIVNQGARERDLIGINLSDADLSGADLSGADLSGADLSGANLSGADLSGADLRRARIDAQTKIDSKWRLAWEIVNQGARERDLTGINLSGANLRSAALSGANLRSADLSGAALSGANLISAYLRGADLSGANLSGANLSNAYLSNAYLRGADLSGANLSNANLVDADLSDAKLSNANLVDADLSDANLSNANLIGANLSNANLSNTNLIGANLRVAHLSDTVVEKAQFGGSVGLTEEMKRDLKRRGAIFEDSPGDRSGVVNHR